MNHEARSDNLLPADDQVAEEVNTDQQSSATRRIGQLPQHQVGGQSVEQAVADAVAAMDNDATALADDDTHPKRRKSDQGQGGDDQP